LKAGKGVFRVALFFKQGLLKTDMSADIVITVVGWLLGGFINGIAGFGAALVAMPIVASGLDMPLALTSCTLVVLALNLQMFWIYRRHLNGMGFVGIIIGAIPGAVVGILMLRHMPETGLKFGLGALLIAYAIWGLSLAAPSPTSLGGRWAVLAGFLSTSLGTAFGINGPSLAAYLAARGGTAQEFKAGLGAFLIASCALIMLAHGVTGMYTVRSAGLFAMALPSVLLGGWIGLRVSGRVPERYFRSIVYTMLLVAGVKMLLPALLA
jgi:uncharacterized membrane protein YfcA